MRNMALWALCLLFSLVLAGCSDDNSSNGTSSTTFSLTSLDVSPKNSSASANTQFSVVASFSDGSTQTSTAVVWSSSNTSVATINSNGLATVVAPGTTQITASLNGVTASTNFTVTSASATLVSLDVTPKNSSSSTNTQFAAVGTFSDNSTQVLTNAVTWNSSNTAAATISASGLASVVAPGTTQISATLRGVSTSTAFTVVSGGTPPGTTFTARNFPTLDGGNDIAYGNGVFVTVSSFSNTCVTTNGLSGSQSASISNGRLNAITFGGSTFVTVSDRGEILTSPNGTTWTARTSGTTRALFAVGYGGGKFLAVGQSGTVLTSPDGITWTPQTAGPTTDTYQAIAYGNGRFVIAGGGLNGIAIETSTDGVTWTAGPSSLTNFTGAVNGITFGNGQFVAVNGSNTTITSTDGSTWAVHTSTGSTVAIKIFYGNGLYIATGQNGTIATSTDGVTFTDHSLSGSTTFILGGASGNGIFVLNGQEENGSETFITSP